MLLVVLPHFGSIAAPSGSGFVPQVPAKFERAAESSYSMDGPVSRQVEGVIENWLAVAPDRNPAMLDMFADRDRKPYRSLLPWSGEFVGKYLTACSQMVRLTNHSALRSKVQTVVDRLVTLQDEDGYLGPFPKANRLTGNAPNEGANPTWDAWGHYHILIGLLQWHEQTGDAAALRCATRVGDLLCDRFLGNGRHVADIGSPDQNQAVIHGLCLLYQATGTKRYLDLAEQIVREFELSGAGDYLRTALAGKEFYATPKPRWESLHAIMGLAELYRITGKEEYHRGFEHIWWSILKLDRHNNGGFSSGEQAVGNPYNGAPIETCCTIAWLAMSLEMLRATGNSVVADEMELSTLNSVVGLHSPDGSWSTYNTPMDGRRIPSTQDISFQIRPGSEQLNCCSVNAARGFGLISEWALMCEKGAQGNPDTLVLNWYGTSTCSTAVAGTHVSLSQETNYPREGRINLHITLDRPTRFPLKLRVPYWSEATKIAVNGSEIPARAGSYCVIDREWSSGDHITIDLDMRLRAWLGERECEGKASLYRGPLLFVKEAPPNSPLQCPSDWQKFGDLFASQKAQAAFEYEFQGQGIKWWGKRFDDAGRARVLIDGKEIAVVDQYAPKRDVSFDWEHTGLAPGKHSLRIEVSGDKSPESKGTWSNVIGFSIPGAHHPDVWESLPTLDVRNVTARLVNSANAAGTIVALELSDTVGQTMRLRDFGTAGQNGIRYSSWLPIRNLTETAFSSTNPLRTTIVER